MCSFHTCVLYFIKTLRKIRSRLSYRLCFYHKQLNYVPSSLLSIHYNSPSWCPVSLFALSWCLRISSRPQDFPSLWEMRAPHAVEYRRLYWRDNGNVFQKASRPSEQAALTASKKTRRTDLFHFQARRIQKSWAAQEKNN